MPEPVPTASVGVTVNVTAPEVLGVPLIVIVPVPLPLIVSPVGFVTLDTVKVTGAEPPVDVIDWL